MASGVKLVGSGITSGGVAVMDGEARVESYEEQAGANGGCNFGRGFPHF